MRNFTRFRYYTKIRLIAVFTAVLCSVMFLRNVCAVYECPNNNNICIIRYSGTGDNGAMLSAEQIENDIRTLTNKGYSPVFASQLADILNEEADIPDKAVIITFDGGCQAYYNKVFPILEKYRFKAVITINGKQAEYASNSADDNVPFLRWDQIKEMDRSGLIEFSNGAFELDTADEFEQKPGESYAEYRSRIVSDIGQTQLLFQLNCNFEPCVFTYPGGKDQDNSARLVKNLGFKAALRINNEPVVLYGKNKADPYRLNRYERAEYDNITDIVG